MISRQVWESSQHSGAAFTVLLALADYATDEGVAYPSIDSLAKKARLSERMTQYAIAQLKKSGEVAVEAGGGRHRTHRYVIRLPETVQPLRRNGDMERVQNLANTVQTTAVTVQPLHPIAETERVQNSSERVQILAETVQTLHPNGSNGATVAPSPLVLTTKEVRKRGSGSKQQDADISEVYEYYRQHIHPASRTCAADKIRARLKVFSVEELKRGIDNFAASEWSMQHNAKRGCAWFFKNDERSETYLNMEPEAQPEPMRGRVESPQVRPCAASLAALASPADLAVWGRAVETIRADLNAANFETYIAPLAVAGRGPDGGLRLVCNPSLGEMLAKFRRLIVRALMDAGDEAPQALGFVARKTERCDEDE